MPAPGKSSVAAFHPGIVNRMTDFHNGAEPERQQLQYTMSTWNGFSGSPVLLPDGRVIAVHSMASPAECYQGVRIAGPHGVRIDCLWQLLVQHKLQDKVSVKIDAMLAGHDSRSSSPTVSISVVANSFSRWS